MFANVWLNTLLIIIQPMETYIIADDFTEEQIILFAFEFGILIDEICII